MSQMSTKNPSGNPKLLQCFLGTAGKALNGWVRPPSLVLSRVPHPLPCPQLEGTVQLSLEGGRTENVLVKLSWASFQTAELNKESVMFFWCGA